MDDTIKKIHDLEVEQMYQNIMHDDMEELLKKIDDMANVKPDLYWGQHKAPPNAIYLKLEK